MYFVKVERVNGRDVKYLAIQCEDYQHDLIIGYIDNFNRVHFYTSK